MNRTAVKRPRRPIEFSRAVGRALRRAGKRARAIAKAHGTPVYVWKDGKVVAEKPKGPTPHRPAGAAGNPFQPKTAPSSLQRS